MEIMDKIIEFLYGNNFSNLSDDDCNFIESLESEVNNLKPGEKLSWYVDYESEGNLYELRKRFPKCHAGLPANKSGIIIYKDKNNSIHYSTKSGYGKCWVDN